MLFEHIDGMDVLVACERAECGVVWSGMEWCGVASVGSGEWGVASGEWRVWSGECGVASVAYKCGMASVGVEE
jgi:hypothetical protein